MFLQMQRLIVKAANRDRVRFKWPANWEMSGESPVANRYIEEDLFFGLREFSKSAFPKSCECCGKEYRNLVDFLSFTKPLSADSSGLKQEQDIEGHILVDLFRNCTCGSTMLEIFLNRRDVSVEGGLRRLQFQDKFEKFVAMACLAETGRDEWLRRLRGQAITNAVKPLQIKNRSGNQHENDSLG